MYEARCVMSQSVEEIGDRRQKFGMRIAREVVLFGRYLHEGVRHLPGDQQRVTDLQAQDRCTSAFLSMRGRFYFGTE